MEFKKKKKKKKKKHPLCTSETELRRASMSRHERSFFNLGKSYYTPQGCKYTPRTPQGSLIAQQHTTTQASLHRTILWNNDESRAGCISGRSESRKRNLLARCLEGSVRARVCRRKWFTRVNSVSEGERGRREEGKAVR